MSEKLESSKFIKEHFKEGISKEFVEFDLTIHVFTVSATLVGVCLTVIGIFGRFGRGRARSFGEDLLTIDAFLFLLACVISYSVLKKRGKKYKHFLENLADNIFLIALTLMTLICGLIVYEVI